MSMLGMYKIMAIHDNIGFEKESCSGNLNGVFFTLNGEKLKLRTEIGFIVNNSSRHIGGGYVRLMSEDESKDYLSFPIAKKESFVVHKITTDTGNEFLIVNTRVIAATDSGLRRFWLIGKYNNQYITYATQNSLNQAGLLYQDISCDVKNGEIQISGFAPYHSRDFYPDDNKLTYKGHKATEEYAGELYINQVRFFWDDSAQWFGVRLID